MKKWLILFTICLDWSLMWIDFTAVNVALAPIASDLHANIGALQWVITAYTLCSAALMAIGGRLGDMYGHRRLFILGTLIFIVSSALAGLAPSANLLILSRVAQGVGIALVIPITTTLVYLTFEQRQRSLALGILTGTTGVAMAIGPTIGGILVTYLSWRWVFFINVPIGLFAIMMARILISETNEKKTISLDYPGIITLAAGLLSLLLALNKISEVGLAPQFWGLLIIAFVLLGLFIKIEGKCPEPLIHLDLLKNKTLMGIISVRTCTQYVFFVYLFILSLYLENILMFTAEKTGYFLLVSTFILGVLSPLGGYLFNHFSARFLITINCVILIGALLAPLVLATNLQSSIAYLYLSLILFGFAYAIHFPITNMAALQAAATNQSALVTGMLFTMAFSGASAGITISGALLDNLSGYKLMHFLHPAGIVLQTTQQAAIREIASGAQSLMQIKKILPIDVIARHVAVFAQQSFTFAFSWIVIICMLLAGSAAIIALLTLKNTPKSKTLDRGLYHISH